MNQSSSRVMHMAHILYKNRPDFAWSDIVRHAWYFERFRTWLNSGIVTFSFWKKDGSIREAKGTTHPLLIPLDKRPKGTDKMVNGKWSMVNYFDLDRNDWRSFNITHFIGFVTIYQLSPFHSSGDQAGTKLKEKRTKKEK